MLTNFCCIMLFEKKNEIIYAIFRMTFDHMSRASFFDMQLSIKKFKTKKYPILLSLHILLPNSTVNVYCKAIVSVDSQAFFCFEYCSAFAVEPKQVERILFVKIFAQLQCAFQPQLFFGKQIISIC